MSIPAMALPLLKIAAAPMTQALLAVGTTAVSFIGQNQQANYQQAANDAANESARVQAIAGYDQLTRAGQQEKAAASQKMQEIAINTKKAVGAAEVSAGEAGISGLGVEALLSDLYGQEARLRDGVNQNLEGAQAQFGEERRGIHRDLTNTINTRPAVERPSLLGAGIEAATGILGAYKDRIKVGAGLGKQNNKGK